ncbi:MAG: DUF1844 domain-containing protein [candidate division Zixibacteria bacterium]|nr:DUF1844 domain-containing protein [candidate division Zixibacteria bacterium]
MSGENPKKQENGHSKDELYFAQLVLSFQAAAYQQMGKVVNPISGKIERNLEMARHSIDMLAMIQEKTKGNLSESESGFLAHVLTELRMNYVEEANKPQTSTTKEESKGEDSDRKQS